MALAKARLPLLCRRAMGNDLVLRCRCGAVTGSVRDASRPSCYRLVCMCDDCQAYAHHLGRADDVLDENGGTDTFYPAPSQVSITQGLAHVRCLRVSPRGPLRWYASCCSTPMAHTVASAKVPFIGIPHSFIAHADALHMRDQLLGRVLARVRGRFGRGALPADASQTVPLLVLIRGYGLLLWGWLLRRHAPSPFFDPRTGAPLVTPVVLTQEQREALRMLASRDRRSSRLTSG